MLTFPVPASLNGDALTDELAAAGFPDADVTVVGDDLRVTGIDDADRDAVRSVLDAHVPPPPPADPADEFRAAIEAATSIADLKAALLGTTGPGAEPRQRP